VRRTLYVAMDDRSGEIIAVNILFMVLTTVIVALRGYCRGWIIRSFGLDDYIMLVTWVRSATTPRVLSELVNREPGHILAVPRMPASYRSTWNGQTPLRTGS